MEISTEGRYALCLILDVVLHNHGATVPLRDVAQRQEISDKYPEQVVTQPSRTGLVRLVRDAEGGYLLIYEPEEYIVGEILWMLEGNLAPVNYVDQDDTCRCSRADRCVIVGVWRGIQVAVSSVVDHLTLIDLVYRYHKKCPRYSA